MGYSRLIKKGPNGLLPERIFYKPYKFIYFNWKFLFLSLYNFMFWKIHTEWQQQLSTANIAKWHNNIPTLPSYIWNFLSAPIYHDAIYTLITSVIIFTRTALFTDNVNYPSVVEPQYSTHSSFLASGMSCVFLFFQNSTPDYKRNWI